MDNLTWHKIKTSTPFMFTFLSLTGFLTYGLFSRNHSNLTVWVLASLAYGAATTVTIKKYVRKNSSSLGLSRDDQLRELAQAVKRKEIPTNKEVRDALPAYLDRQRDFIERQRKFMPLNYVIFGFFFLGSLGSYNVADSVIFGLIILVTIYWDYSYKKRQKNIAALQEELKKRHIKMSGEAKQNNEAWKQAADRKSKFQWNATIFMFVVLAILIVWAAYKK